MRAGGWIVKGQETAIPHLDMEAVKEWAKEVFTKDRIVVIALAGSTLAVLGVLFFTLYGAMQTNTIVGTSPLIFPL